MLYLESYYRFQEKFQHTIDLTNKILVEKSKISIVFMFVKEYKFEDGYLVIDSINPSYNIDKEFFHYFEYERTFRDDDYFQEYIEILDEDELMEKYENEINQLYDRLSIYKELVAIPKKTLERLEKMTYFKKKKKLKDFNL